MTPQELEAALRDRRVLVAFSACDPDSVHGVGIPMGYFSEPTVTIAMGGRELTWLARLTREATPAEAIEYWKQRALAAEGRSVLERG